MARSFFLGALVLLLGALIFFLFGSPDPSDRLDPDRSVSGGALSERVAAGRGDSPSLATPDVGGNDSLAPGGAFPEQRGTESRSEASAAGAGAAGVELTLRRADSSALVPGAQVLFFTSQSSADRERFLDHARIDGLMEERGRESTADANAVVWLPPASKGFTYVVARAPGLWGRAILQSESNAPRELKLAPDSSLRVRVLQGGDRGAQGAPIVLRSVHGRQSRELLRAVCDAEGRAVLAHVSAAMEQREANGWQVIVDAPTLEPVGVELDPAALPQEELVLRLPPSASVRVSVLEVDGKPFGGAGEVALGFLGDGESRRESAFGDKDRMRATRPIEDGAVRFDWVPLDQELELRATRAGAQVATRLFAAGPRSVGEALAFEVRLGSDHPVLLVRAVDTGGAALAGEELAAVIERHSKHLIDEDEVSVTSDKDGRFLVDLDAHWLPDTRRSLKVYLGPREAPDGLGSIDLSRPFEPGLHDLGDLVLGEPPVFVRGQVVDEEGVGVGAASLRLESEHAGEGRWREVWDFRHRTDEEGHFRVAGGFEGQRFRLSIQKNGYSVTPVPFAPGETLTLVAARAGELPGSLLFDEGLPLGKLQLSIEAQDPPEGERVLSWRDARRRPDKKGRFRFSRIPPGRYRVEMAIDGDDEKLLEVEDIFVPGGETIEPRLQNIDLRGRVSVHRLVLEAPTAATSLAGQVQLRPSGNEEARWEWRHFRGSEVELISRHSILDVMVNVEGYRAEMLEGLRGDAQVTLRAGIPVRLVLGGSAEVPPAPICVKAVLLDAKGPHGAIDWGADCFDASRETRTQVNGPGRKRVQWVVERRSSGSAIAQTPRVEPVQYVEVAEGTAEQVIELRLSQAQMDEMVRSLGG